MGRPASKETRDKLINNTERFIQDAEQRLRVLNETHKVFDQSIQECNNGKGNLYVSFCELVIEFEIGRIFILSEIASSLRNLIASDLIILKRYHILQMRARIQEGMKYFMGYQKDKRGVWQRMKPIVEEYKAGKYLEQYIERTNRFKEYCNGTGNINKKTRDIVEHFDSPTIMYLNWSNSGDEEFCCQMSIAFFDQIQALNTFVQTIYAEMLMDLGIDYTPEACENQIEYQAYVNQLIVNAFREKLYPHLIHILENTPAKLESQHKTLSALQSEYFKAMSERLDYASCRQILTTISEAMMFISLVRTELACAIVTYIQSTTDFERTLNLRRLLTIKTSTLSKLYGIKEEEQNQSHWHCTTIILSIIDIFKERREQLEKKIQKIVSSCSDDLDLRSLYVHYRDGKSNNVLNLFDKLDSIDPIKEVDSTHQLLLLIKNIEEFYSDVIFAEKEKMNKRSEESDKKFQEDISFLKQIIREDKVPEKLRHSISSLINKVENAKW